MTLNELRDKAFAYAERQGFHKEPVNFAERIMLVVTELSEAVQADRGDLWASKTFPDKITCEDCERMYALPVAGSVEEEIADALIRMFSIAGIYNIDLDYHVNVKMAYNETRPCGHGKKYG